MSHNAFCLIYYPSSYAQLNKTVARAKSNNKKTKTLLTTSPEQQVNLAISKSKGMAKIL